MTRRLVMLLIAALACGVLVAACGGDDSGGSGGGTTEKGSTSGAKTIDPKLMDNAKGTVTYCGGKDTSGKNHYFIKQFNKKFGPDVQAKLVEFPASADEQRNQFIQRQQAKSGDCDLFESDVIWTAEFASQKWLYDITPYMNDAKKSEYIQAPIETATYDGKIWGAPQASDAAFIYYRTDKVKTLPTTWQDVYKMAKTSGGIVYQGAPYEGLTCDYLELLFAAGGSVLNADGTKATIDSPQAVKALQFMVDGIKDGAAPKAVTTYMEPESLTAFQTGKYAFMRNWPYAYALNQKDNSKVKNKFKVMPFPAFEGGGKAGILGGHNTVISRYSKNPGAALKLLDFISGPEIQKAFAVKFSQTPVLQSVYDDPDVKKALPFSDELKQAVSQAKARPVSPVYPQISQAIYKNVNNALSGQTSAEDAIKQAQADITKALSTF